MQPRPSSAKSAYRYVGIAHLSITEDSVSQALSSSVGGLTSRLAVVRTRRKRDSLWVQWH